MMGTRLRAKARVPAEKALVMSDAYTQLEMVRKEASVHVVGCSECPYPSGAKVSPCTRRVLVEDLLCQVVGNTV